MARALDVAYFLIQLADSAEEPDHLTHLRLHKLLYYVQGWSLALRGRPMFPDAIEAWAHGPVVPSVYKHFEKSKRFVNGQQTPSLNDDEREFIQDVWETYKDYSALKLRDMIRRESPWKQARHGFGPAEFGGVEISKEALREHFSRKAKAKV
ncbi:MAG: DUF4065 domain-containing protein [Gemmataceae bacterium]|nr:DUF4065 domain-containing protein [Gemmataceae bacterium]